MSVRLWSLAGNRQKLDGGAMFGNAPRAMWAKWVAVESDNRIDLACRALLAEGLNGKRVLFETGIGAFFDPKLRERYGVTEDRHVLLDSLAALGLSDADIDVVVLSHLHFDHAGGLLAAWQPGAVPRLLFPNATFVVSRRGFERACAPHARDRASFIAELPALLRDSGRLELVDSTITPALGETVHFHFSDGHTPGLMMAELSGAPGLVFCADLIPGKPWVHVPVTMGYDRNAELLIDEKQAFLQAMLSRGTRLFFTHDPDCAMATLQRDDKQRFTVVDEHRNLQAFDLTLG